MTFNSVLFFFFLSVVFCLYWFVFGRKLRGQNLFIVVASYVFYGWWDWRFLILLTITAFCSWGSGLLIRKFSRHPRKARLISAANIILNIGILGVFKYYDFFAQTFADLFLGGKSDGLLLHLILPVGISFYTFQALSYSIDVYKGKIEPTRDIVQFFAYVSFFPQLVAGPIERSTSLLPQFGKERVFNYSDAVDGLRQMLWGFFKKIVVADSCALYVDQIYGNLGVHTGVQIMTATVLHAIQTYGDFSGYSDIAIGCAKLFGIKLMRNFATPFFSRNLREFWQRWHISLMSWFRDYVYFPLGGSRCSRGRAVLNVFIVFILCALWHGASWTKVLWGVYYALLVFPAIISGRSRKFKGVVAQDRALPTFREVWQMSCTFLLMSIGVVLIRAASFQDALYCYRAMMHLRLQDFPALLSWTYVSTSFWIVVMLVVEWVNRREDYGLPMKRVHAKAVRYAVYLLLIAIIVLYFDSGTPRFIYFQF